MTWLNRFVGTDTIVFGLFAMSIEYETCRTNLETLVAEYDGRTDDLR